MDAQRPPRGGTVPPCARPASAPFAAPAFAAPARQRVAPRHAVAAKRGRQPRAPRVAEEVEQGALHRPRRGRWPPPRSSCVHGATSSTGPPRTRRLPRRCRRGHGDRREPAAAPRARRFPPPPAVPRPPPRQRRPPAYRDAPRRAHWRRPSRNANTQCSAVTPPPRPQPHPPAAAAPPPVTHHPAPRTPPKATGGVSCATTRSDCGGRGVRRVRASRGAVPT